MKDNPNTILIFRAVMTLGLFLKLTIYASDLKYNEQTAKKSQTSEIQLKYVPLFKAKTFPVIQIVIPTLH
jgi:hypothetical protein